MRLGNPFTEIFESPMVGADQVWYCPEHPQSDFYDAQGFAQARAAHGMTLITSDAMLTALPVGARIFLYFDNNDWADGYYATIKIE